MAFNNEDLPAYVHGDLTAYLKLSGMRPENRDQLRCIQQRLFAVQLAEPYRAKDNVDVLLVTNTNTTHEEVFTHTRHRTRTTAHVPPHTHHRTQISGLKFSWNSNQDVGWRVVDAWSIDSEGRAELINNNTRYSLSMLDFMAKGGDDYTIFSTNATNVVNFGYTLNQVILQQLAAETAMPGIAPRIVTSSAVKRNCLAEDGSLCNNNGLCVSGACRCDAGTEGSSHGLSRVVACLHACAPWFAKLTSCA